MAEADVLSRPTIRDHVASDSGDGHCDICNKIDSVLENNLIADNNHEVDIGLVEDLVKSSCPHHRQLFNWLSTELKFDEHWGKLALRREFITQSSQFLHKLVDGKFGYQVLHRTPLFNVEQNEMNRPCELGVRLDPKWIDKNRVYKWFHECIDGHEKCSAPDFLDQIPVGKPEYLVDTAEMCLVSAPQKASFIALSYVWGKVEMVKTKKANLAQLQEPGSLHDARLQQMLPKTVRHAIQLLPLLGVRYLWVDTLCIVQDDEDTFKEQLIQMASIYAHATAVIAAVDGPDANYGLHGWKGMPDEEHRHIEQLTLPFCGKTLIRRLQFSNDYTSPRDNIYCQRAWTFQEFLFAKRKICFENGSVWFQCCEYTQYEDHAHSDVLYGHRDWTFEVGYPSLDAYCELVQNFNVRQLSYAQDCLSAFTGLLSCYTKAFKGGFLCGLPEMFFDIALLWQPSGELQRRVSSGDQQNQTATEACLPSWSWVGWSGEVDFRSWSSGNDWIAACRGWITLARCQTFPTTTWYTADYHNAIKRRCIDVDWFTWRDLYQDETKVLPRGWWRREKRTDEILTSEYRPTGYGKYIYEHPSTEATFWYPMPLFDPNPQPKLKPHTRYLFASVQSAWLHPIGTPVTIKHPKDHQQTDGGARCISLCNAQQEWAGLLRLHNRTYFNEGGSDNRDVHPAIQVIVLSRGRVECDFEIDISHMCYLEDSDWGEESEEGKFYEYYNVMWISWEKDIARREAVGRVHKAMWDSLDSSTIDVVLE